jgi:LytS/YehU family sensor histidine kinase
MWASEYLIDLITQSIVCLSCISYFYISALIQTKERLSAAQRAQSEMQLKLLQQKVDPHFLFNNLNVLSSLVEKNPKIANEFLAKLSELYRYILHTQNVDVVPIKDELDFAENYLYLLKQRFGEAYNFDWQIPPAKLNGQMIVPAALQGLLENVVKHNAGNQKEPLRVCVKLDENFLLVENEIRAKSNAYPTSGTGLQNLTARYAFLTEQKVEVRSEEKIFKVSLPLLRLKK